MSPSLSKTADDFLLCPHSFEKKKKKKKDIGQETSHDFRNTNVISCLGRVHYLLHMKFDTDGLSWTYRHTSLTHALLDLTSRNLDHSENISKTSDKHKSSIPAWRKNTIDIDSECQIND